MHKQYVMLYVISVFMHTLSFSPFLVEGFAAAGGVLVFARPEDGQTDVMTVGCTIHLRSGEVEMAVTVGTKASAALVSISWKKPTSQRHACSHTPITAYHDE